MFVWSSAERFTCLTFLFELSEYIDGKIDFLWAYNIQMHDSILTMSKANYNYGCLNALSSFLTCYVHNFNMFWVHIYYWDICIELSSCQFCVYNVYIFPKSCFQAPCKSSPSMLRFSPYKSLVRAEHIHEKLNYFNAIKIKLNWTANRSLPG